MLNGYLPQSLLFQAPPDLISHVPTYHEWLNCILREFIDGNSLLELPTFVGDIPYL